MNMEFTALLQNNTWDLVPAKSNINLVGNKWVYRIKTHANGTVERYKARLVAKGYIINNMVLIFWKPLAPSLNKEPFG